MNNETRTSPRGKDGGREASGGGGGKRKRMEGQRWWWRGDIGAVAVATAASRPRWHHAAPTHVPHHEVCAAGVAMENVGRDVGGDAVAAAVAW